jgi:hypothetical protein
MIAALLQLHKAFDWPNALSGSSYARSYPAPSPLTWEAKSRPGTSGSVLPAGMNARVKFMSTFPVWDKFSPRCELFQTQRVYPVFYGQRGVRKMLAIAAPEQRAIF